MECPSCRAPQSDTQRFCSECGSSLHPAAPARVASDPSEADTRQARYTPEALETGTTFAGRYQIIEELGRGGMGRVYKVIDQEVHGKVALKLIRPEIALDPTTIARFRQELTTARAISHKNICRVYDLGRDGTTYFLTMEYVSGTDLKSMIGMSGQLGVGTAISIAKQVCDGLAEAHRLGVIHRDLKPQNIQIDRGGQAKIMDFGLARSVVVKGVTDGGMAVGTPQYMSPEQAEARGVDARSDIYALGVMLYEMLTGRVPFDADTPLALAMKHKLEAPRDPLELNASIPPDLGRLILKCLEKDKERRYQSASEVHEDLVRIEQGLPTSAKVVPQPSPSTSRQITRPFTTWQLLVPALVVVALAAVLVGAWRWWPQKAAPAAPTEATAGKPMLAVLYFENISGDASLDTWRTGLPELIVTTLSQSQLLNVVSTDHVFGILKRLNLADAKRYSADDLANVAKEGHAQYLLTGSVMKAGQTIVITARLRKMLNGEVLRSEKIECQKEEEIPARIDDLAREIKADLNLSPQAIGSETIRPTGQVLTSSPEALRYYTEARRLHVRGAYRDALPLYQRAIDADPGFAMAYRGMSAAYSNIGERAKADTAIEKALALSDRLPELDRYHIQINAYSSANNIPQVIATASTLLSKYPSDTGALFFLAFSYETMEEYEKSIHFYEAVVEASPTYINVANLAEVYSLVGRYDDRRRAIERYLERDPNNAIAHAFLGQGYLITKQFAEAQRESDKALLLEPTNVSAVLLKGDVAHLLGDVATAEHEYLSLVDQQAGPVRRDAHVRLAMLYVTQGRWEKARGQMQSVSVEDSPNEVLGPGWVDLEAGRPDMAVKAYQRRLVDPAIASHPDAVLYLRRVLGQAYVVVGNIGGAQQALDDLNGVREGVFVKMKTWLSLWLSGALAAKRGDGRAAVADLERAVSMLPGQSDYQDNHAGMLDALAQAYTVAGDLAKARETYEKITALTTGRLSYGATYARSYYHLGLIAERQGDKARARENFSRFLDLWKNADPGQPEVIDARKRMAQ